MHKQWIAVVLVFSVLTMTMSTAMAAPTASHDFELMSKTIALARAEAEAAGGHVFEDRDELEAWLGNVGPNQAKVALSKLSGQATHPVYIVLPLSALTHDFSYMEMDSLMLDAAEQAGFATQLGGSGEDEPMVLLVGIFCSICIKLIIAVVGGILGYIIYRTYIADILWRQELRCPDCDTLLDENETMHHDTCSFCGVEGRLFELFSCDDYVRSGCNTCGGEIWSYNPY